MANPSPQQTYNQYKVRPITWNKSGKVYGISLPREVALQFLDVKFNVEVQEGKIILTSGLDLVKLKKEIKHQKFEYL